MLFREIVPNARKIPDWISFLCGKSTKRMIKAFLCSGLTLNLHILSSSWQKRTFMLFGKTFESANLPNSICLRHLSQPLVVLITFFFSFVCLLRLFTLLWKYYFNTLSFAFSYTIIKIYGRNIWLPVWELYDGRAPICFNNCHFVFWLPSLIRSRDKFQCHFFTLDDLWEFRFQRNQ